MSECTDPQTQTTDENGYTRPDVCASNVAAHVNTPTRADLEGGGYCDYDEVDQNKGYLTTQHSKSRYINTPTRADLESDGYSDPHYYAD